MRRLLGAGGAAAAGAGGVLIAAPAPALAQTTSGDLFAPLTNLFTQAADSLSGAFGLDWDTVKTLDAAALAERLLPADLSTVETIAMDEFAMRRGQRYPTVILEPLRKRVLWVGEVRDPQAYRPAYNLRAPAQSARHGDPRPLPVPAPYQPSAQKPENSASLTALNGTCESPGPSSNPRGCAQGEPSGVATGRSGAALGSSPGCWY